LILEKPSFPFKTFNSSGCLGPFFTLRKLPQLGLTPTRPYQLQPWIRCIDRMKGAGPGTSGPQSLHPTNHLQETLALFQVDPLPAYEQSWFKKRESQINVQEKDGVSLNPLFFVIELHIYFFMYLSEYLLICLCIHLYIIYLYIYSSNISVSPHGILAICCLAAARLCNCRT